MPKLFCKEKDASHSRPLLKAAFWPGAFVRYCVGRRRPSQPKTDRETRPFRINRLVEVSGHPSVDLNAEEQPEPLLVITIRAPDNVYAKID